MSTNPYQPPPTSIDSAVNNGVRARRAIRVSLLILILPAIYNYYQFDARAIGSGIGSGLANIYRATNIAGFVIGVFLIWSFGLTLLEWIAERIRRIFALKTDPGVWSGMLHESLFPAVYLAIPGAILWALWVFGFYVLELPFVAISWLIGIPAHLLGAALYVPLFYRWYKLASATRSD